MSVTEHMHDLPVEEETDVEVEEQETEEDEIEVSSSEKSDSSESKEDAAEEYSDGVKKRINKLTSRMREAERREKAALDYAQGLKTNFDHAEKRARQSDQGYLSEYDTRLKLSEGSLNDKLKNAIERGDVDAQVELQGEVAKNKLEAERLNYARRQIEAQETAVPNVPQQAAPQQAAPSKKAESWSSKNEWFGSDEPMTLTAFSIHKDLVQNQGFDPESDDYYVEIDRRMRDNFPHKFSEAEESASAPRRSNVASTGRASSSSRKNGKKSVKLSSSQVAIAKKLGVSLEDYAKQVSLLETRSQ
jgi:hypothetical protein